ncbi:MAG: DUF1801 domain-containing protein [Planctomycetes bacterium]|nr:DUF1801 domain-containing protein [Planctomycetota bacterium]
MGRFESVGEYVAAQPPAARRALALVRSAIRKALPNAVERISYHVPTHDVGGQRALFFACWKRHYSLYPATARLLAAFGDDLAPYEVEKATIRFPLSGPVPTRLIERIARFRAKEVASAGRRGSWYAPRR